MREDLKEVIKEILAIVKTCPENLQEKCFEILLNNALGAGTRTVSVSSAPTSVEPVLSHHISLPPEVDKRIKLYAGQNNLDMSQLRKVFGFDETGVVTIEVTDLKAKKIAQQQRRLALLVGIRHQLMEGKFDVPTEEIREMCVTYGTYDAGNFGANLKSSSAIFAGFKASGTNKLSPVGKKEAAELIVELAS